MARIELVREGITIEAKEGETILRALFRAGIDLEAPCGGRGLCGKCRVYAGKEKKPLLACQTLVSKDLTLELSGGKSEVLTGGVLRWVPFAPAWRTEKIPVKACPPGKSLSDWSRIERALYQRTGRHFPLSLKAAGSVCGLTGGRERELFALTGRAQLIRLYDKEPAPAFAALDLGSSTLAAFLLDGQTGELSASASRANPQRIYGQDVVSRLAYVLEHGAQEELAGCIRGAVSALLAELCEKAQRDPRSVSALIICANSCMHHLFLGIWPESLCRAPYHPAVSEEVIVRAGELGLLMDPEGEVCLLPNIGGYIGSDTLAALAACALSGGGGFRLLLDLGTNAEMVLSGEGRLLACSAAAGPAFEGAKITCGMSAFPGAICHAALREGRWEFETVGNQRPAGICGSGLLDLAALLLENGWMDESGLLKEKSLCLVPEGESADGQAIILTGQDMAELLMAKAAIAAGIRLLCEKRGIGPERIESVYLAGAFGSFLTPESACRIGLLPGIGPEKVRPVGNAAGCGAVLMLRNAGVYESALRLRERIEFVELGSLSDFGERFVDELCFPAEGEACDV